MPVLDPQFVHSADAQHDERLNGVVCDYMEQRSQLVERFINLTESAQWTHYEKAVNDLRKEIERIDEVIRLVFCSAVLARKPSEFLPTPDRFHVMESIRKRLCPTRSERIKGGSYYAIFTNPPQWINVSESEMEFCRLADCRFMVDDHWATVSQTSSSEKHGKRVLFRFEKAGV